MTRTTRGILSAAAAAALALSLGPAAAETFRYAHVGDVNTLDPYQFDETVQLGFLGNIYEPLVGRGTPAMQLEPALATSWELVEPTRWRFHLRKGVKFHNGNDFTAEDVIFSAERARHPNSQVGYRYGGVTEIVAVDEYTVDMVSEKPNPFLINNFFYLYIMDKDWAEEHDAVIPAAMGAAGEAYANLHANGTGPFKVVRRVPDVETVVEPFDGWWGEKKHNITQAIFRPISSDPTRVAALLSGELDLIYPVPIQDVARVDRNDGTFVLSGPENPVGLPHPRPLARGAALFQHQGRESLRGRPGAKGRLPGHRHRRHHSHRDAGPGYPGPGGGPLPDRLRLPAPRRAPSLRY